MTKHTVPQLQERRSNTGMLKSLEFRKLSM